MQNPNHIRYENPLEEDKYHNEGLVSFIENDYVLNFLNDPESAQRRAMPQPTTFPPMMNEMQLPFPGFQEASKNPEHFANIYGKINIQDAWFLQNMTEANKLHNTMPRPMGFKLENPNQDLDGALKTKKIKIDKDIGVKKPVEVAQANKGKSNIKNTYINKINSLITEPEAKTEENKMAEREIIKPEIKKPMLVKNEVEFQNVPAFKGMKKVRSYDVLKSDEIEKLNVKLARNRESARNSRKRKKVYIELLEKKVAQLQSELHSSRKQLENNSNNFNKLAGQSKLMNTLYAGKQQLFEKLEKVITTKNDETEVSLLIDSLRFRLGANGKERTNALNFFFKQIIEFLVPVHMKYLLWTATDGKDLFSSKDTTLLNSLSSSLDVKNDLQTETTEYWNELLAQVNPTEQQKKVMMKYRKRLMSEKQKFEGLISSLNHIRKSLLKESESLQDIVDEFRNILSPAQTGKFLLVLDKERNRKEFSSEKLWNVFTNKKANEAPEFSVDSNDFADDDNFDLGDDDDESDIDSDRARELGLQME